MEFLLQESEAWLHAGFSYFLYAVYWKYKYKFNNDSICADTADSLQKSAAIADIVWVSA